MVIPRIARLYAPWKSGKLSRMTADIEIEINTGKVNRAKSLFTDNDLIETRRILSLWYRSAKSCYIARRRREYVAYCMCYALLLPNPDGKPSYVL